MTGFDYVENVFYSHKNFNRPDLQSSPHQHFEQEVELLDSFFAERGKMNIFPNVYTVQSSRGLIFLPKKKKNIQE